MKAFGVSRTMLARQACASRCSPCEGNSLAIAIWPSCPVTVDCSKPLLSDDVGQPEAGCLVGERLVPEDHLEDLLAAASAIERRLAGAPAVTKRLMRLLQTDFLI